MSWVKVTPILSEMADPISEMWINLDQFVEIAVLPGRPGGGTRLLTATGRTDVQETPQEILQQLPRPPSGSFAK